MRQPETGRFWRRFVGGLAAYSIALQATLSGLGLTTLAASANASALPICGEHAADPADAPALPASDPWLCPCAASCLTTGGGVLSRCAGDRAFGSWRGPPGGTIAMWRPGGPAAHRPRPADPARSPDDLTLRSSRAALKISSSRCLAAPERSAWSNQ